MRTFFLNYKVLVASGVLLFLSFAIVALFFMYKGSFTFLGNPKSQFNLAECKIYGVNEIKPEKSQLIDSQFVVIDPTTEKVELLGPLYKEKEFEGIDIHPVSGIIYTNTSDSGDLYILDAKNGNTSLIGNLDYAKINSLAFHPQDNTLWGWAEERGLVQINTSNASTELIMESIQKPIGLAWNSDATLLYASIEDDTKLFSFDQAPKTFTETADTLPENTEGLATLPNNLLLGANSSTDGELFIYIYNPQTKEVIESLSIKTPYYNLEGMTWPAKCGMPF